MKSPIANLNPVAMMERFWEAHDFIIKAMTTHDGRSTGKARISITAR